MEFGVYSPEQRAREKSLSRDRDERAMKSGAVSPEEMHEINGNGSLFRGAKILNGPASLADL